MKAYLFNTSVSILLLFAAGCTKEYSLEYEPANTLKDAQGICLPSVIHGTFFKNTRLNPVWNETNIILINNLNEVFCILFFDRDNLRKDRPLGQANFDLKSLEEDPIQDDVICKVFRNAKERGSIRIRAAFTPPGRSR